MSYKSTYLEFDNIFLLDLILCEALMGYASYEECNPEVFVHHVLASRGCRSFQVPGTRAGTSMVFNYPSVLGKL